MAGEESERQGTVRSLRRMGGVAFVTLEDGTQVVCSRGQLGHRWDRCSLLVPGNVVAFEGVTEGGREPGSREDCSGPSFQVTSMRLLQCNAHPSAVVRVVKAVTQGALTCEEALASLQCSAEVLAGLLHTVGSDERDAAAEARKLSLQVARNLASNPVKRRRRPHIAWADRQRLQHYTAIADAFPLTPTPASTLPPPLDPAHHLEAAPTAERCHYCVARKGPQVAWVLQRLDVWLSEEGAGWTVVDIGCGRGDLAVNVAVAFPAAAVVACDHHLPSLEAGQTWAAQVGVCNVRFQRWDARWREARVELLRGLRPGKTVFLGLHACGGLTDVILDLARRTATRFLCITCCFTFHSDLRVSDEEEERWWGVADEDGEALCRLAEMQGDDDVAQRAMHIVNVLRLQALRKKVHSLMETFPLLEIVTFPTELSPKNQVLIGVLDGGLPQGH
eukprot:GGOE01061858.1.p1 GENE.GGOE01061858.1~~GGOE01061858.1.p1  ORF type:complete len:447 (-),score=84.53 GGOE01061858.1:136-1476(-)